MLGMPELVVSGSWARPAGRQLGEECAVGGCDFTARDCCLKGGHILGAAQCRPATHLTGEAPLGTVRIGSADTRGEGKGWTGLALEQRAPPGPGKKAWDSVGEMESSNPPLRVGWGV